jgi:hypothetical protein
LILLRLNPLRLSALDKWELFAFKRLELRLVWEPLEIIGDQSVQKLAARISSEAKRLRFALALLCPAHWLVLLGLST